MAKAKSETPLMKQYYGIKAKYPDAILLFRVGDFYETFDQDAITASKILGIVLTKRSNGAAADMALAGFPHHSLDTYLPKLVRAGYRVAICDQLEDPKMTKTIVKRGVTELVTPGVSLNDQVLHMDKNNFLCSICTDGNRFGIAFIDVSTGEFLVTECLVNQAQKLLQSFSPNEVIYPKSQNNKLQELRSSEIFSFGMDEWVYKYDYAYDLLLRHFKTNSLKGFSIEEMKWGIIAAGAALHYVKENQQRDLSHISTLQRLVTDEHLWMDKFTVRNLELFASNSAEGKGLIDIIDHTQTAMGSRLLKRWLAFPLKSLNAIQDRLHMVEVFIQEQDLSAELNAIFSQMGDVERLLSKLSTGKINPKELLVLRSSLRDFNKVISLLSNHSNDHLRKLSDGLHPCKQLLDSFETQLLDEAPSAIGKGRVFKEGVFPELDELYELMTTGKDYLLQLQNREMEATGISSLKVAFNNVFGYYLEVRNTHKDKVPDSWIRKQTLVNAERYVTPELKEYETKILNAEGSILTIEQQRFEELLEFAKTYISHLQTNAHIVARLDVLLGFAQLAQVKNYNKPEWNTEGEALQIIEARHPVIEHQLPVGVDYIPNDIELNKENQSILMITGPNMSGKSALLRQTALVCILAQMGCYVPAKEAKLVLLDKLFVRVGASDNISQGESTFMVEMNETASILNNLSPNSLILLDEIGRGTSTYDGISIAWSIAEFLHEHPSKPFTLFATHYHELNEMEQKFSGIKNFNVAVKELKDEIVFLRKLTPGGSHHSFGIHVAQMAGVPHTVVANAKRILMMLEESRGNKEKPNLTSEVQLSIFKLDDPLMEELRDDLKTLDINSLTPIEALMKLHSYRKKLISEKG